MLSDDFTIYILLLLISIFSNFISALSGGGAGLLQLPALLFLGLPFPEALATHKVASVFLGLGATVRHVRHRNIEPKIVFFILISGMPGVFLGSHIVVDIPTNISSILLGLITLLIGIFSKLRSIKAKPIDLGNLTHSRFLLSGIGLFIIGFLNGCLSSGTGLLVTILLVYILGMSYQQAVAYTLILVGFFWNSTGAIVLSLTTKLHMAWMPPLILGSFLGGLTGAHFSILKGSKIIKLAFEVLCIIIGTSLLLKSAFI